MEILANKLVFVLIDPDTLHYRSRLKILYLLVGVFLLDLSLLLYQMFSIIQIVFISKHCQLLPDLITSDNLA